MAIEKDLLDRLLADYKKPEDLIGETGLLKQLTKALLERALEAELTDHLGHEKHAPVTTQGRQCPQWQVGQNHQGRIRQAADRGSA